MNHFGRPLFATIFLLAAVSRGNGQMILIGSTVSTMNQSLPSTLVDINRATGEATNPRDLGISLVGGIASQPSTGVLFGLTTFPSAPFPNSLITIDPVAGTTTVVGNTGLTGIVEGDIAFHPLTGVLYGVQTGMGPGVQRNMFTVDPVTGMGTILGPTGSTGDLSALAFSPSGVLYSLDTSGTGNSLLLTLDTATGGTLGTQTMNLDLGSVAAMTFDPNSGIAYVSDRKPVTQDGMFYTLDVTTATLSPVGPLVMETGISGLAFVTIPEPSGLYLLAVAIAAWFGRHRIGAPTSKRPWLQR